MNFYVKSPPGGVATYPTFTDLPPSAADGTLAVTLDTDTLYVFNATSMMWLALGAPSSVLSIGPIDSQSPSANGATINVDALIMQSASTSFPGLVNTVTQSFAGNKTFTGTISASNLSGTNTGDVTLGTANGLSLVSQALSLGLSSTSTTGALSSTDWNTFNSKQPSGSYITALTGDGTASGPGSAVLTLSTVNSNVGTFESVTVNAKGLVTAATALSGDATTSSGVLTLATVNSNVGSFSPAAITVNAKGLVTAASNVTTGNLTDAGTDGITVTNGTGAVLGTGTSIAQHVADTTHNGYLSSTDWNTFNSKQPAGSYITALTGDVTASGPGSAAASLTATSNATLTTLSALTTATSLASIGTITSGTWNATVIAPTYGGSSPLTKVLYVDGNRSDTYTPNGSINLPFKTISAAISQIITNNDNSTHQYNIIAAPFGYSETLTFNSSTLYNIVISNLTTSNTAVQNVTVNALTSTSNNTQLGTLIFNGITFNGAVNLTGDTNGTNFGSSQILFSGCQFNGGNITLNNVNNVSLYGGQIQGATASTWTNVAFGYVEGAEGFTSSTTLHLVDNPGGNVPSQYSGNYVLFSETKFYGTLTIDAGSEADFLESYTGSVSSVTNNGTIHSWSAHWGGTVTLNNGSLLRARGDTFLNAPTVNAGATFTYQNISYANAFQAHQLLAAGTTSGVVSILPQAAAGTFNFNLPTTAGTSGQVLTSAGGGSSPMTWSSALTTTLASADIFVGNASNIATATALSGDATLSNTGALTLATVNANVGSFGSSTSIPSFTVNAKGLITAASGNAVIAPAGTLSGTTLNSTVVSSSLTSVDTISSGTWQGTAVGAIYGGTGQTSYTTGDTLYASATNVLSKLSIGSTGQVLTVAGGVPTWASPATSGTVTSVALADGSTTPIYAITGSPVTSSGTLTFTLDTQSANTVFAGPTTGVAAQPTFRGLVSADIPNNAANTTGTASNITASSNSTLTTLSALTTASSLSSIGTITSGAWQGTAIAEIYGGTNQTTYTTGDILYASASNTLSKLPIGSTNQVLTVISGIPSWQPAGSSGGTVTTVSVVSANGLAGTVANPTTTPAITLSTTINSPVLAGNGTAISAATTTGTGSTVVLSAAPAITGAWTLTDAGTIVNASDATKQLAFSLSGMTAAKTLTLSSSQSTTQTLTIPNITASDTLATLGLAQTFSAANTFSAAGTALTVTNGATIGTLTLTNPLTVANGGTGRQTLTNHGVLIGAGTSAITQLAAATAGTVLTGQGTSSDPSFTATPTLGVNATTPGSLGIANGGTSGTTITVQNLGNTTAYNFNLPTTPGSSGQVLTSQAGGSTSMTWTTIAAGVATAPTQQIFTSSSGTYTTPASVKWIRVRMIGGGGGGSGSGTQSGGTGTGGAGGTGGNTTFGTSLLVANGGTGGADNQVGGSGGTASLGSGPTGIALTGGTGDSGGISNISSSSPLCSGSGSSSPFGGAGGGMANSNTGNAAATNTGSGGGGGGYDNGAVSGAYGSGGGAGGFIDAIISAPNATYSYAVGAAGTAGTAGTSGNAGGAGGSGYIVVEEHYNY